MQVRGAGHLGHLVALTVAAASDHERPQVEALAAQIQAMTGQHVELAFVDSGYTGPAPAASAAAHGIELVVVKTPEVGGVMSAPGV